MDLSFQSIHSSFKKFIQPYLRGELNSCKTLQREREFRPLESMQICGTTTYLFTKCKSIFGYRWPVNTRTEGIFCDVCYPFSTVVVFSFFPCVMEMSSRFCFFRLEQSLGLGLQPVPWRTEPESSLESAGRENGVFLLQSGTDHPSCHQLTEWPWANHVTSLSFLSLFAE